MARKETKELLNSKQAAEYVGLKYRLFLDCVREQKVPCYNIRGNIKKYRPEDLDAWVETLKVEPSK